MIIFSLDYLLLLLKGTKISCCCMNHGFYSDAYIFNSFISLIDIY